jgi:hypothetical protein
MTNKKYVSKPIDTGKNTDTSDLQQIVTSQEFELYRSSTDRHQSRVLTLLIFNRSSSVKSSNSWSSTDRHQWSGPNILIFNRSSPVKSSNSIDLQQIVTSQEFELYRSSTYCHQSRVRTLLIFNRSSPVKSSNSIDLQQIVTSQVFEHYWSSTDRY